jgi:hypothetical protein
MTTVFIVITIVAGLISAVKYQIVYNAVIDSLPPQFQDPHTSRYAFPVYALTPSTPLPLQGQYVQSQISGSVMLLSVSLALLSAHQFVFGCLLLCAIGACIPSGIKSWKTYRQNCERAGKRPFSAE